MVRKCLAYKSELRPTTAELLSLLEYRKMEPTCAKCHKQVNSTRSFECGACPAKFCSKTCRNIAFRKHQDHCLRDFNIIWEDVPFPINQCITEVLFRLGYMSIALQEAKQDDSKNALLKVYIDDYLEGSEITKDDVSICSGELKTAEDKERICVSIKLLIKELVVSDYLVSFQK